jgi:S-formylglutathione hydrolase FrmB
MQGFVEETPEQLALVEDRPVQVLACLKMNAHRLPPLRFDCGTDDFFLAVNRALDKIMTDMKIVHTYEEFPGGHTQDFWARSFPKHVEFFSKYLATEK